MTSQYEDVAEAEIGAVYVFRGPLVPAGATLSDQDADFTLFGAPDHPINRGLLATDLDGFTDIVAGSNARVFVVPGRGL